ncbi:MAG: GUN4 domain-containing protein [Pegethrix bostrychoides GSE-TBD4-15B]|jgi:hypothetical protein|uniref:GUN4 domain-containing protein n=1 Tax=Pegethrix bostrychoides GSE-TBD4-15B TaxID=2839662 RepID=A0A951PAU9_9CYAN|nr:GUN4 domain-containing protein [Pegethrix bostrychoides GSE-TBD4-15B]
MSTPEESYRALVQQYRHSGSLSADEREALETNRMLLRLLPDQARAIEQDVMHQAAEADKLESPEQRDWPASPSATASELAPSKPASHRAVARSQPRRLRSEPPASAERQVIPEVPASIISTILAPQAILQSPDTASRREKYKQVLREAYLNDPLLTTEIRAELNKLAQILGLTQSDAAAVEDELSEEFVRSQPPALASEDIATVAAATAANSGLPAYDPSLSNSFEALVAQLGKAAYEAADQQTHDILLKVIQPVQSWLDVTALREFPKTELDRAAIQAIDRLWSQSSAYRFGFGRQLALYGKLSDDALQQDQAKQIEQALLFSQKVDWWIEPLKFYKFYAQLNYSPSAEYGHLPAYWFWQLPRSEALKLGNLGLAAERGGCRVDALTLPEFMAMLRRCGIKPEGIKPAE